MYRRRAEIILIMITPANTIKTIKRQVFKRKEYKLQCRKTVLEYKTFMDVYDLSDMLMALYGTEFMYA